MLRKVESDLPAILCPFAFLQKEKNIIMVNHYTFGIFESEHNGLLVNSGLIPQRKALRIGESIKQ